MEDLKNIKAGDKVAHVWYDNVSILTVDRVTPTGRIVIGNNTYKQDGRMIAGTWSTSHITPVTGELIIKARRQSIIRKLESVKWGNLSDSALEQILSVVNQKTS